ncbi:MAG: hypothetical protein N3A66_09825, partial [Planctomycetota bacterium]|nr:hypothetical protein [Planctomycetota bacterium]
DAAATAEDPLPGLQANPNLEVVRENIVGGVADDDENPWRASELLRIRPVLEDIFRWLKAQSHEAMAAAARPRHLWNYNKVMREPDRWRLQVLHVYGELVHEKV